MADNYNSGGDREAEDAGGGLAPAELWRFTVGAARRHFRLGLLTAVGVGALAVTVTMSLPQLWEARSRIHVATNAAVTGMLSNPNRPTVSVEPFRGASDFLLEKQNLQSIVKRAKLDESWTKNRGLVYRIKDSIFEKVFGPPTEADRIDALGRMLETRVLVENEGSTALEIHAFWNDRDSAVTLANLLKQSFLDERLRQETRVITAAIEILEDQVKIAATELGPLLEAVQKARDQAAGVRPAAPATPNAGGAAAVVPQAVRVAPRPAEPVALPPDPTISLKLQEVRQNVRNVEEPWRRHIADLKAQLSDLRSVYGPAHPAVIQQDARIREASVEPPGLSELKQQEAALLRQIEGSASAPSAAPPGAARGGVVRGVPAPGGAAAPPVGGYIEEPPEVSTARAKLTAGIEKYNQLVARVDAARLELVTDGAAFKYRYIVVVEPEPARKPVKPNRPVLLAGGIGLALFLGFVAGAIKDLMTGRLMEPWQVRRLGIPLLAEIDLVDRG